MDYKFSGKIISGAFITIPLLFLGGCFNFGGTAATPQPADERTRMYETSQFTVSLPKEWEVIEKDDFTSEVPPETVVVFRNNVKNENFTANVNIVKNNLQEPIATLEYAKKVLNRQKTGLYDYKESRKDEMKMNIGGKEETTYFTLFEAKKGSGEKLVRYLQTYAVAGNSAYIVTGAVSPQESDTVIRTVEEIVKSFKLK